MAQMGVMSELKVFLVSALSSSPYLELSGSLSRNDFEFELPSFSAFPSVVHRLFPPQTDLIVDLSQIFRLAVSMTTFFRVILNQPITWLQLSLLTLLVVVVICSNFDEWVENRRRGKHIASYKYRSPDGYVRHATVYKGSVKTEALYYFVLARDREVDSRTGTLRLSLHINRSLYDTSNLTSLLACNLTSLPSDCSQGLPIYSTRYALFLAGDSSSASDRRYYPHRSYSPRHWLYFVGYGIPSIVLTVLFVGYTAFIYILAS